MIYNTTEDTYVLQNSGRRVYAYAGIIGLSPVFEGIVEGGQSDLWNVGDDGTDGRLDVRDAIEIGEYMIDLWTKFVERRKSEVQRD